MICQPCAAEADHRVRHDVTRCAACKMELPTYTSLNKKIVWHRVKNPEGGPRIACPGSGKHPLIVGHAACTGCDCAHFPPGTRQVKDARKDGTPGQAAE